VSPRTRRPRTITPILRFRHATSPTHIAGQTRASRASRWACRLWFHTPPHSHCPRCRL